MDDGLRLARDLPSTPFMPLFDGVEEIVASAFILPIRHRVTGVRVDLAIGMSGCDREAGSRATLMAVGTLLAAGGIRRFGTSDVPAQSHRATA